MTGLNLETFLRLLRADLGAWLSLAAIAVILGLMAWTSWGKKRALRKCLVLSIAVHIGLVVYGRDQARFILGPGGPRGPEESPERIQQIRVVRETPEPARPDELSPTRDRDGRRPRLADWDRPGQALALAQLNLDPGRPESPPASAVERAETDVPTPVADSSSPEIQAPDAAPADPRAPEDNTPAPDPDPPSIAPAAPGEVAPVVVAGREEGDAGQPALPPDPVSARGGPRPSASGRSAPEMVRAPRSESGFAPSRNPGPYPEGADATGVDPAPASRPDSGNLASTADPAGTPTAPDASDLPRVEPPQSTGAAVAMAVPSLSNRGVGAAGSRDPSAPARPGIEPPRRSTSRDPVPLVRAAPAAAPGLPDVAGPSRGRGLPDIPEVYRSRLAPDRSERALAAGATPASEQAVERALIWLARHQDADGRWNAGTRKANDGRMPLRGEANFTSHCPAGDVCDGECYYWEADTAVTGLALLAYLGAGHTHTQGRYARTVTMGLNFLLNSQKSDGDLRGVSRGVGMYCHAIASLAVCEAYALTGDERLRRPAEKAVEFLVKSRTADGLAWRYAPNDPYSGDTSILGWAIMVLKSAKETGLPVPSDVREGALKWLSKIAEGDRGGLAIYRPGEGYPVTPTMTAEAWVCRQFLGVGGPGPASEEASSYLLLHGPDRDPFNLYYWYYGTLAMYQHGGEPWARWNARVRDQVVRRQVRGGHADGSWDPADCKDQYDQRGGRIYATAVAALTLEVYYRYLRLYDAPASPPTLAPAQPDESTRRAGFEGPVDERPPAPGRPR